MSTDLRAALRDAVAAPPDDTADLRALLELGAQRVHRRTVRAATVAASVLAAAAVVTALLVLPGPGHRESEPQPAKVVQLDLEDADFVTLDVVAVRRALNTGDQPRSAYDRFEGITPDGLVLRARYNSPSDYRVGLLDPASQRTDWFPRPPLLVDKPAVAVLSADRVLLFDQYKRVVLLFDRSARTWTSIDLRMPAGIEVHVPPRFQLGPDGRLYMGSNLENEYPMHWWSYSLPEGWAARDERDLDGLAVVWTPGGRVTADIDGRVVRTVAGASQTLSEHRPASCPTPPLPMAPSLDLAGDRPVVTYWCGEKHVPQQVTVVLGGDGEPRLEVDGAALAADRDHVLLAGHFLLDLRTRTLHRIGSLPGPGAFDDYYNDAAAGLVLWSTSGPGGDQRKYDAVWKVARLP